MSRAEASTGFSIVLMNAMSFPKVEVLINKLVGIFAVNNKYKNDDSASRNPFPEE